MQEFKIFSTLGFGYQSCPKYFFPQTHYASTLLSLDSRCDQNNHLTDVPIIAGCKQLLDSKKRNIFPCFCKVSKRIRNIAHDESLWLSMNLCTRNVPIEFLSMIINNGCKYLNLFMAEINGTELKLNQQSQLKYLDISRLV